jgi:hypothetical protein
MIGIAISDRDLRSLINDIIGRDSTLTGSYTRTRRLVQALQYQRVQI